MWFQDTCSSNQNFAAAITSEFKSLHLDHEQYPHIVQIRKEAVPGDMLEFQQGFYTLYALYLGDGQIMTIFVENNQTSDCGRIQQRSLTDVCGDGKARVRNHEDIAQSYFSLNARQPQDIVQAAKVFENRMVPYEFDFRNSEYYCTLWRYGKGFSTQVAKQVAGYSGSRSDFWAANTSANFYSKDGYAKYKKLADIRLEAFENRQW